MKCLNRSATNPQVTYEIGVKPLVTLLYDYFLLCVIFIQFHAGLSAPGHFKMKKCTDQVVLVWKQIAEKHDGYCINHRSKTKLTWNSCCIKKNNPMLQIGN